MTTNRRRKQSVRAIQKDRDVAYMQAARELITEAATPAPSTSVEVDRVFPGWTEGRTLLPGAPPLPVARYDFDVVSKRDMIPFATEIGAPGINGEPRYWMPRVDPHMMICGVAGSGKSAAVAAIVHGAISAGWEVNLVAPSREEWWYRRSDGRSRLGDQVRTLSMDAEPWDTSSMLADIEAIVESVHAEMNSRFDMLGEYKLTRVHDLPHEHRPAPVLLVMDDALMLLTPKYVSAHMLDEPGAEAQRQEIIADNKRRARIAETISRFVAQGRAVSVHVILVAQRWHASETGGAHSRSIRANCARLLVGQASAVSREVSLNDPEKAPTTDEADPRGTAIFETFIGSGQKIQLWFATPEEYAANSPDE